MSVEVKAPETIEAKIAAMHEFTKDSFEKVQAERANMQEELTKFQSIVGEIQKDVQKLRQEMPSGMPLTQREGDVLAKRGRMHELGIMKALGVPSDHGDIRADDQADISRLQKLHDASVMQFHVLRRKHDMSPESAGRALLAKRDFQNYIKLRARLGFGTEDGLRDAMAKGTFKHYHDPNTKEVDLEIEKADEVMNPAASAQSALDFTILSPQLIERMRLQLVVANAVRRETLTRANQTLPTQTNDAMGVWGGGSANPLPERSSTTNPFPTFTSPNYYSNIIFGSVTYNSQHCMTFLPFNDDMEEDSIIPFMPRMLDAASYGSARAIDRAILDGDTAGTHRDADVTATNDLRKAWNGIRKMSVNNDLDNSGGQFDVDDFHALRTSLGIYGWNVDELICFANIRDIYRMIGASSGSGDLLRRVDTIGDRATLLRGTLATVYGIPLAASEFVRIDVDATGVRGVSGNTKSIVAMLNHRRFALSSYGLSRVESWRVPPKFMTIVQADARVDFKPWDEHALSSGSFTAGADVPCNVMFNNA